MKKLCVMFISMIVAFVVYSNVFWNEKQALDITDIALANIEALAQNEGGYFEKCYSTITKERESKLDGSGKESVVSMCETHVCVHGNGTMCTTGSRCVYYYGTYEQTEGSISNVYCLK